MKNKGFTLLAAIFTTSMLLIVAFAVSTIAYRQLEISNINEESQIAFYAANSGVECAQYWDLSANPALSAFATSTASTIYCNGATISAASPAVPTVPSQATRVGGGGNGNPTSIFMVPVVTNQACAIVTVNKAYVGSTLVTTINSNGYNTCDTTNPRRVERGVRLSY